MQYMFDMFQCGVGMKSKVINLTLLSNSNTPSAASSQLVTVP